MNVIEATALGKRYDRTQALSQLTLHSRSGLIVSRDRMDRQQFDRDEGRRLVTRHVSGSSRRLVEPSSARRPMKTQGDRSSVTWFRRTQCAKRGDRPWRTNTSPNPRPAGGALGDRGLRLGRIALTLVAGAVVIFLVVTLQRVFGNTDSFPVPSQATLAPLNVPQRIVAIAESQVGYSTEPAHSYCNKYSADWDAGTEGCPSGEQSEEWCADFAAWAWQEAGVQFTYGYGPGEINGGAVSFYEWGVANGEWHPATSGYVASPWRRGGLRSFARGRPVGRACGNCHRRHARPAGAECGERGREPDRVLCGRDRVRPGDRRRR